MEKKEKHTELERLSDVFLLLSSESIIEAQAFRFECILPLLRCDTPTLC